MPLSSGATSLRTASGGLGPPTTRTTVRVFYGGAGGRSADDTRELVMDSFQEWGPIRSINVIPTKTIAFVQYYWRCSAEFAKEAMHAQCLKGSGSNEVLSVCWANDDPNPVAVRQVKREREHVFDTAVQNHVESLPEDQKRARLLQEQMAATGAYPDTDAMYGDGAPAAQAAPPHPSSWHAMAAAPTGGWAWAPAPAAPCGVPAPQWGQAEELQDDVSRYCADDPYYDQEPEMDPPTAGGGEEEGTGPRADGAAGARESGEAEPPPGDAALQLIAGYGSGDEGSD
uniref:Pre-mrna-splicing factor cwc2 n=1 Tax=Tetraselmis sp. GSL018 TaxID=582737 RepID=A0A061SBV7_9CHLO